MEENTVVPAHLRNTINEAIRAALAEQTDRLELAKLKLAFEDSQGRVDELVLKMRQMEQMQMVYEGLVSAQRRQLAELIEERERCANRIAELEATVALLQSSLTNRGER